MRLAIGVYRFFLRPLVVRVSLLPQCAQKMLPTSRELPLRLRLFTCPRFSRCSACAISHPVLGGNVAAPVRIEQDAPDVRHDGDLVRAVLVFHADETAVQNSGLPPSPRERVSKLSFITTEVVHTGRAVMTNNGKLYDYATGDEMRDKNMAGAAGVYIPVQTIPLATRTLSVSSSGV